jgi:hypothetical protein
MAYCLAQIVLLDRSIAAIMQAKQVLYPSDIREVRRLKEERKLYVRAIQNYQPQGASL